MGYRYETHMHTSEVSVCGKSTGAEMVQMYYEHGYTGVIVTDHFLNGNTNVRMDCKWEEQVAQFCLGYDSAKKAGDALGMDVFFGWEYSEFGWHFLTYGLDRDWLLQHPQVVDWSPTEYFDRVHGDGGLVVQAHPYREAEYIRGRKFYPQHVHAIEVINGSHRDKSWNEKARIYAEQNGCWQTSGSDSHRNIDFWGGGMEFEKRLVNVQDFIAQVKNGSGILLGE